MKILTEIDKYNKRLKSLKSDQSQFLSLWKDLAKYHLSHRGQFLSSDGKPDKVKPTKCYNNRSRLAVRTLAAGMMAGVTSPGKPWFRLSIDDKDLRENDDVKMWLGHVEKKIYKVFHASNLYTSLHTAYQELGVFGVMAMGVYPDFDTVINCKPYTIGSYMLASDNRGRIDTFYREYCMSVHQLIHFFGYENCSSIVQGHFDRGSTETSVEIVHVIERNDGRDSMNPMSNNKPYRSVYYEKGTRSAKEDKFLRKSGFDHFRILAPRWDSTTEGVYSNDSPGIVALGDTRALQLGEKRLYQAVDKVSNPPLQAPIDAKNKVGKSLNPGQIVYTDKRIQVESIYGNYRPDLNALNEINKQAESRIDSAFYTDLFLMLANGGGNTNMTAREVAERHEEKLLMLGPVLDRLHHELLDPLIDITFESLQSAGVLPPPPDALSDTELKVEYVSVLAQAQKMIGVTGIERVVEFTGALSALYPEARHKLDPNEVIDQYAEMQGVPPGVLRSDDEVEDIKQAEAQARAQAQQLEASAQMAQTAKTTSEVDVDNISDMVEAVT